MSSKAMRSRRKGGRRHAGRKAKRAAVLFLLIFAAAVIILHGQHEKRVLESFSPEDLPAYEGDAFTVINGNKPFFTDGEINAAGGASNYFKGFEEYAPQDSFGRCGAAFACVGLDTVPPKNDRRGYIDYIFPTGFRQEKYTCIESEDKDPEGGYLYERCHLIAWCLSDEDDNELNLITGTSMLNDTMWQFEEKVQNCIYNERMHCLYRVTPVFTGDDLLCRGVLIECLSAEDRGKALSFCVFCHNVQPGVTIYYEDGSNEENTSGSGLS